MLNINYIRETPEKVKENLKKRYQEEKIPWIDEIIKLDKKWKILKQKSDSLRNKRNILTDEIRKLKSEKKDIKSKLDQAKKIPETIQKIELEMSELKSTILSYLERLPNILQSNVPLGEDPKKNVPFRFFGNIKEKDFDLKSHTELLEETDLADFEAGRINSGQGFNYLIGDLALLDLALQRFGVEFLVKKGFTVIVPPLMLNKKSLRGAVVLSDFQDVIYKLENEDLHLIGTSEHPLVTLYKNKTFSKKELPLKLCAVTPCFRKEIGGHGVDSKGLFRMHQFNKVEQVIICSSEDSNKLFEEMQSITEEFFKELKIPFRSIEICSGDLGQKFSKQYDIEAYFPRQKEYKEVTSCGNTTDYQSTSLNIKYKENEEKKHVYLLNNTMVATSRAMVAIIENFQNKKGEIEIPKPLRKYMFGKKKIGGY